MIKLYSNEDYENASKTDLLPLQCYVCNETFYKTKFVINRYGKYYSNRGCGKYCSLQCEGRGKTTALIVKCKNCEAEFSKLQNQIRHSPNHFCSKSCAATYNNTHKTTGSRISKLELWLKEKLSIKYPKMNILYCNKSTINSELDIYIPSLKLAFELNGIYHYEPIHGVSKLQQIQTNDNRKFQACLEHGIELCIIDTSSLKYFKEQHCLKYLDIISNIINSKQ